MKTFKLFNSNHLHILAMIFMLIDHIWAVLISGNFWMNYIGRLAFPLYAFMLVQGFIHTSDLKKYKKRMLFAAIISEIPFNLVAGGGLIYPFHQNVCWTLLLGLYALEIMEGLTADLTLKERLLKAFKLAGIILLAAFSFSDYGTLGLAMILLFYITRKNTTLDKIIQLIGMIALNIIFMEGLSIPVDLFGMVYYFPTQGFAVFALPLIWLYNGKKGSINKALQLGFYAFYPVHLLIIGMIAYLR